VVAAQAVAVQAAAVGRAVLAATVVTAIVDGDTPASLSIRDAEAGEIQRVIP
jgi:hypothetical protein